MPTPSPISRGASLLIASTGGYGFIVPEDEVVAATRKGKQVLNVMLVFKLDEVNEMTRGKGVILQRFKDGNLADGCVFKKADGLSWIDSAGRTFTLSWSELRDCVHVRAQSGRLVPKGFPRSNSFGPVF